MFKFLKTVTFKDILYITIGALLCAFAVTSFVGPAGLIPSGISGLTVILIKEINTFTGITISYGILYWLLNLVLLLLVIKHLGKKFLFLSFLHVTLMSIFVDILPIVYFTNDKILLAVFAGFVNAMGITLALKANGSSGGTDFIAIYYSKVKNRPMWSQILYFNMAMLIYAGWRGAWEASFYSIVYQIVSSKTIEMHHDRYKLNSIHIITEKPFEVSEAIMAVSRHGITKFDGIGMYKHYHKSMLYMILNQFEVDHVVSEIHRVDPYAFVEISSVLRVLGNYRQKPLD